ncbi:FAD-binding oxidoreductase [Novosphingobium sp.]|uniref:FAD-binding oxidoreductase n=1 Tax=Novosphingobium sp. TaxID=1874826 RepID=UPI002FD91F45
MESPYYFPVLRRKSAAQLEPMMPARALARKPPKIDGCTMLTPGSAAYNSYLPTYNLRTARAPSLRALCATEAAVAKVLTWLRDEGMRFAVRSGGHSFEGYSESPDVVIDVRSLNSVTFDPARSLVKVGAGASLQKVYDTLSLRGMAIAAGTCPVVGIAGHLLGGGYGLLARKFGLACDSLTALRLIDARSTVRQVGAASDPDLFWASQGGGGGSFGIATSFTIRVHPVATVVVFGVTWLISDLQRAARLAAAWQDMAFSADPAITALFKIGKLSSGAFSLRCFGQSVGSEQGVHAALASLLALEVPADPLKVQTMTFAKAVAKFAGSDNELGRYFTKEKSDFAERLTADAVLTALAGLAPLPAGRIILILSPHGGAVSRLRSDVTAFPHREGVQVLIHYFSQWSSAASTAKITKDIAGLYASMRPHVTGGAYVNYCDQDMPNFATRYWGANLPRLSRIKKQVDPANLFRFPQSVPLAP